MKLLTNLAITGITCGGLLLGQTVDQPLKIGGDVKAPVLIKQVDPRYNRPLFGKRKEGEVLVHLIVSEDGMPTHLTIAHSVDKKLDKAALESVSQYRFKPATRDDKPVAVELSVAIKFSVY